MANDEHFLPDELLEAVCGREPSTNHWTKPPGDPKSVLLGGGSGNLPLMKNATKLWRKVAGIRDWWLEYLRLSVSAFMGREQTSPYTYGDWIPMSVACVSKWARENGDSELLAAAQDWLVAWAVLSYLYRAPDGTLARCGQRGAGEHAPGVGRGALRELAVEIALNPVAGNAESNLLAWCRGVGLEAARAVMAGGKAPKPSAGSGGPAAKAVLRWDAANYAKPERALWFLAAGEIRAAAARVRAVGTDSAVLALWPKGWEIMVPISIVRTPDLVAVWIHNSVNSNTPPILAAVWRRGKGWRYLPANGGGHRVRQVADRATCELRGTVLVYVGDKFASGSIDLGAIQNPVVIPPLGIAAPPEAPPTPPPTAEKDGEGDPPPASSRPPWYLRAWDRFRTWLGGML